MQAPESTIYQDILEKAQEHFSKGDVRESLSFLDQLDTDLYDDVPPDIRIKMTNMKGIIYLNQGQIKKGEEYSLRSLDLAKEYGDPVYLYKRYDNLAALYSYTKEYHLAHYYLQRSIELKELTPNEQDLIPSLLQMAALFFHIDNLEAGKDTAKRVADIMAKYPPNKQMSMHYDYLMGMRYKREKKYGQAIAEYDKAQQIAHQIGSAQVEARSYNNQGDIYMQESLWAEAKERLEKALNIATAHKLEVDELTISIQLALVALKQGDIIRCNELHDHVRNHIHKSNDEMLLKDLEEVAALMYEAEGDYAKSLQAFKRHISHYKKQYDNELSRNVVNIQSRYEMEKSERKLKEAKLQQVESELKALQAEHLMQEREKRFKTLIENSTDGIVIISAKRSALYMSPYVYKILGYVEDEMTDVDIYDLIHPDDQIYVAQIAHSVLTQPGYPFHGQFRFPKKTGEYIWIEGTGINLLNDEGVNGVVCNFRDISERKENEAAIQNLNKSLESIIADRTAELKEVVKDLEAFSYSVSHDLRSPLRIIAGYAKLLLTDHVEKMDEEANEFVGIILDNTKRMGQLIDDLLNFSRLGRKALYKSPIDMTAVVNSILHDMRKAHELLPDDLTVRKLSPAFADHALTKQVWVNLISNAVKYTSKKSTPIVEIGSYDDNGEVVYYIRDNGAGFDMRFAHNLFGVFKRLHDRSDFDGIGVGLALAHRIVHMHEGRIWAEAEVEKGATFFFTLGSDAMGEGE